MNINVSIRHMEGNSQLIKDHAQQRADKLSKFSDEITRIEVVVSPEGQKFAAETIVSARKGKVLVGHATAQDAFAAVDASAHKVERQLGRFKEKLKERKFKETDKRAL